MSDVVIAIDEAINALLRLRAQLVDMTAPPIEPSFDDDLIDTWTASQRFDIAIDTVRWLAREKHLGEKRGGRWLVSVRALREHIDRGE